jgi:hypothetical protein
MRIQQNKSTLSFFSEIETLTLTINLYLLGTEYKFIVISSKKLKIFEVLHHGIIPVLHLRHYSCI